MAAKKLWVGIAFVAVASCGEDAETSTAQSATGTFACSTCAEVIDTGAAPSSICTGAPEEALANLADCSCGPACADACDPTDCPQPTDGCIECTNMECVAEQAACRAN